MKSALNLAFNINNPNKELSADEIDTAISIAKKLENKVALKDLTFAWLDAIDSNPTYDSQELTKRAEILNAARIGLIDSGASVESIAGLEKRIDSPPRKPNLSKNLIDLSNYYTASLFHYSGWWGSAEHDDLRTLPDQYDQSQNIPFDLRGIIQLNSGKKSDGNSANDNGYVTRNNKVYPDYVNDIQINSKAKKIHFLTGLLFGNHHDDVKGIPTANITINYDDKSQESFQLLREIDIFDYGDRNGIEKLDPEKIGWLGQSSRGHGRGLTKTSWQNPYPDKEISHIDIQGGLSKSAPFIVAITIEEK